MLLSLPFSYTAACGDGPSCASPWRWGRWTCSRRACSWSWVPCRRLRVSPRCSPVRQVAPLALRRHRRPCRPRLCLCPLGQVLVVWLKCPRQYWDRRTLRMLSSASPPPSFWLIDRKSQIFSCYLLAKYALFCKDIFGPFLHLLWFTKVCFVTIVSFNIFKNLYIKKGPYFTLHISVLGAEIGNVEKIWLLQYYLPTRRALLYRYGVVAMRVSMYAGISKYVLQYLENISGRQMTFTQVSTAAGTLIPQSDSWHHYTKYSYTAFHLLICNIHIYLLQFICQKIRRTYYYGFNSIP